MAREKKEYASPPIIEAIYELFVEPRADLHWDEDLAQHVRDAFEDFSGRREEVRDVEMKLAFRKDEVQHGMRQNPPRFRWWHQRERRAIQAGAKMCAHNVLPPYSQYEDYVETTFRLLDIYLQTTTPLRVDWAGQRYINEIRIPADKAPSDYFSIYPGTLATDRRHPKMALQVETASYDDVSTVTNLTLRRSDEDVAVYALDIYARSADKLDASAASLVDWHNRAHGTISQAFELSITDSARAMFGEKR